MSADRVCEFRPVRPPEAELVSGLARAIWKTCYLPDVLDEAELEHFFTLGYRPEIIRADLAEGSVYEWILLQEVRVGFLSYRAEPGADRLWLRKLYLVPEHQGQGLGARALARVKAIARCRGYREVGLYVFRRNERAIRAYLRAGFVIERAGVFDAGGGFYYDDYVMVCPVSPQSRVGSPETRDRGRERH